MAAESAAPAEVRAARIAAIAALVGALVGAFGAGVPVLVASDRQIAAQNERSSVEFLRAQRQSAYAKLLADDESLRELETEYLNMYLGESSYNGKDAVEIRLGSAFLRPGDAGVPSALDDAASKGKVIAQRSVFGQDVANARLIGSSATVGIVGDLLNDHSSVAYYVETARSLVGAQPDSLAKFMDGLSKQAGKTDTDRKALLAQTRADLGTS